MFNHKGLVYSDCLVAINTLTRIRRLTMGGRMNDQNMLKNGLNLPPFWGVVRWVLVVFGLLLPLLGFFQVLPDWGWVGATLLSLVYGLAAVLWPKAMCNGDGGFGNDAEEMLRQEMKRERKALIKSVIETSKDGFYVIDMTGRLLEVNDTYCAQSGYARSELLAMGVQDLEAVESAAETAARIEKIQQTGSDLFETRHRRKDGSVWPLEASVTYTEELGGRMLVFCRDITERVSGVAELQAAHQRLQANHFAMDNVGIGVCWVDAQAGCFLYCNSYLADLVGYSVEAVLQMNLPDIAPAFPIQRLLAAGSKIQQTGGHIDLETTVLTHDRHPVLVEAAVYYQEGYQDLPAHFTIFVTDVTQRKQAQQALIKAEVAEASARAKSTFMANMSHEIRTPLNAVMGLARMGYRDSAGLEVRQIFGRILDASQQLMGVINDILDFSKIEAGKYLIESLPFQLSSVLSNANSLALALAQEKGIQFKVLDADVLPEWVLGDALRLQQVLTNLYSNAVKFTAEGEVSIRFVRNGDLIRFDIADTGIGMTADQIEKLFLPFEQADASTTRNFGGTGLGLTISLQLAQLMGGDIKVSSQPGQGSTFMLTLPLPAVDGDYSVVSAVLPEKGLLTGCRILVAEDIDVNRCIIEDMLTEVGAHVVFAENGQQAVALVAAHPQDFDVVLMDIQMPVMGGYEATQRIRSIAPNLPVIGLTAHALAEERERCVAVGMRDHVTKPVEPALLFEAIRNHCVLSLKPPRVLSTTESPSETPVSTVLLDLESLLARFNGRQEFVRKLFEMVLVGHGTMPQQLRDAATQGRFADLTTLAHQLKGLGGNLKIYRVHQLASETEAAARAEQSVAVELALELAQRFESALSEIRMELASDASGKESQTKSS